MDQNITTVLTTLITVLGTLGGAIIGVVLTNHHALRLETLKMKQEKGKRNAEIIEEVYSLLRKIRAGSREIFQNEKDPGEELSDEIGRVETLVRLYLPSIIPPLDSWLEYIEYSGVMGALEAASEILQDRSHDVIRRINFRILTHIPSCISVVKKQKWRNFGTVRHNSFRCSKQNIFSPVKMVKTVFFASTRKVMVQK